MLVEREDQVVRALGPEPAGVKDLLARIYTDVDPKVYHLAERSLLSGLLKLEEEGRALRDAEGRWLAG